MNVQDKIKNSLINLRKSIQRFPITILASTVLAILLIYQREVFSRLTGEEQETLIRISMVVGLGMILSLAIGLLLERFPKGIGVKVGSYILGFAFLIFYYFMLLKDINMVSATRYFATVIFLIIAAFYVLKLKHDINYEIFVIKVFFAIFLTLLYCGVLFGGVVAILRTIDGLFDINIDEKYYFYTFLIVGFIFGASMFLSKVPERDEDFLDYNYPRSLKVLLAYIVIPLISIYTLILYVYFIKILVQWEWPKGLVSHLVIWYSAVSVGVIFLVTPVLEENKFAKAFRTIFPIANLPILLMMYMSIYQRIAQYGITENRYYIVLFGLWITAMMLYFILKRQLKNIIIPISLSIIVLVSVYGPISSYSISKLSQNNRINKILSDNGMLENGNIISNPNLSLNDQREISNVINYFMYSHSLEDLKVLPEDFEITEMEDTFGFKYRDYVAGGGNSTYFGYYIETFQQSIDITGYEYYLMMSSWNNATVKAGNLDVKFDNSSKSILVSEDNLDLISIDVNELALGIHDKKNIQIEEFKSGEKLEDMTFMRENENIRLKIIFTSINGNIDVSTGEAVVESADYILLIDVK
ncbi:DUF4153 domain-containing protein [Tissierella creatinini]|nr:DUF4153 domain-containing protein [Tissierella creatinini]TJX61886.1 DUF4153 domain-containing protein [Soehngenia saccharolytica]